MTARLRFGIYGAGAIARDFALGLAGSERCRLTHVCARRAEAAEGLAREFDVAAYGADLDALLADPNVDAVYVATPHTLHEEPTLRALAAGKHVLCEKPLAPSAEAVERMLEVAAARRLVLWEGYMYRCHPLIAEVAECVRSGAIGAVRHVDACFGFAKPPSAGSRLDEPALAGGGIWDIGGYPLSFALFVAGLAAGAPFAAPIRAEFRATLGPSGVDEWAEGQLHFESGLRAQVAVSIRQHLGTRVVVTGELGRIEIPTPWLPGGQRQGTVSTWSLATLGDPTAPPNGVEREVRARSVFALEADRFAEAVASGQIAWPFVSAEESRVLARLLGEWRASAV